MTLTNNAFDVLFTICIIETVLLDKISVMNEYYPLLYQTHEYTRLIHKLQQSFLCHFLSHIFICLNFNKMSLIRYLQTIQNIHACSLCIASKI